MKDVGFDNQKYLTMQSAQIKEEQISQEEQDPPEE